MKNFSISKKGYDKNEVDDYLISLDLENSNLLKDKQARIDELKKENIELSKKLAEYQQKEHNISKALTTATQKAEEIEETAKLKYTLQVNNLNSFYEKWNNFFDELLKKYPKMQEFDTKKVLQNIQDDITKVMKNEFNIEYKKDILTKEDAFSSLLDKLKTHKVRKQVSIKKNKNVDKEKIINSENEIEYNIEKNKINNIKPITNLTISNEEKDEFDSLVDKFLHTQNKISKGYEKSILNKNKKQVLKSYSQITPNESGFDINEALNPTEDLLKIMKGFKLD